MKTLLGILMVVFVCASVQAQAPIRRNYFTTNAAPVIAVAGTNVSIPGILSVDSLVVSNALTIGPLVFGTNSLYPQVFIDVPITSASASASTHGYNLKIDGNEMIKVTALSDAAGSVSNKVVTIPNGVQFSPLGNTNYTVYAAGTAYSLTTTPALLDFGTTDPTITIAQPGTYLIHGNVGVKYNGATYVAAQTATVKFRRTNNTAADLTSGSRSVTMPVLTTFTGGDTFTLPPVIYTTTSYNDIIQLFGSLSAAPSAGSVDTDSAEIIVVRIQ